MSGNNKKRTAIWLSPGVICRMDVDIYWVEPRAAEKGME